MDIPSLKFYIIISKSKIKLFKSMGQISLLPKSFASKTAVKIEVAVFYGFIQLKRSASNYTCKLAILSCISKK